MCSGTIQIAKLITAFLEKDKYGLRYLARLLLGKVVQVSGVSMYNAVHDARTMKL